MGADEELLDVLLLHSPLVGPPSLAPLADALRRRGHAVVLPDLTGVVDEPRPTWMVDAALAALGEARPHAVVAHSGSGAVLPLVAAGAGATSMVFLDAVLPHHMAETYTPSRRVRELVAHHTGPDGRLDPWLEWWSDDLVAAMLPELRDREAIRDACVRLPASFYAHDVSLPDQWAHAAYVALGGAYADEVRRAAGRGWPCRSLGLHHLAAVTHADKVADAVLDVLAELARDRGDGGPPRVGQAPQ